MAAVSVGDFPSPNLPIKKQGKGYIRLVLFWHDKESAGFQGTF